MEPVPVRAHRQRPVSACIPESWRTSVSRARDGAVSCFPLVTVFDFGYSEVERQIKAKGTLTNKLALERTLQLGISEEVARLERSMSWLATTATVSPFIGLLGTVFGIIRAFAGIAQAGSSSLRAVAPGISEALIVTAFGLAAAIPAAVAYNYFGTTIREFGTRMEDFSLEFLNLAERSFED